jgi:hypothetical protein
MKIEFKKLENGSLKCKNTGFEAHPYDDNLYSITDNKGIDIIGEYINLEEGIQAIKDYINE